MLHGCSNLFFVLPPLLTMFEACSVAVFGWQRVSTAFYGAITHRRLSVRRGWNVSGVNTGCPGSTLVCQGQLRHAPSLTVFVWTAASPNSDGRRHGTVICDIVSKPTPLLNLLLSNDRCASTRGTLSAVVRQQRAWVV